MASEKTVSEGYALHALIAIYIVWITNFFETRFSVHSPWERTWQSGEVGGYLRHAIATGTCGRKICAFGRDVGLVLGLLVICRIDLVLAGILPSRLSWNMTLVMWLAAILGGLALNLNFAMYLAPAAALDLYLHPQ